MVCTGRSSPRTVGIGTEYRGCAVATKRWKLSYFPQHTEGQLFDRVADPGEQENLFGKAAYEKVQNGLFGALLRWRALQDPVEFLSTESKPGAQTATIVNADIESYKALSVETRLQDQATQFDDVVIRDEL